MTEGFKILIIITAWVFLGAFGMVYVWTAEDDFTVQEVILLFIGAVGGPVCFLVGLIGGLRKRYFNEDKFGSHIIFKKYEKK